MPTGVTDLGFGGRCTSVVSKHLLPLLSLSASQLRRSVTLLDKFTGSISLIEAASVAVLGFTLTGFF